jgi:glycosyltransferase involved in cell wall biosynthesis
LEYLVFDGGSTDETVAILKRNEGHLLWKSEKDQGQADAVNKGFRMARGQILGWLNSDDTYLPGTIRRVVEYFQTIEMSVWSMVRVSYRRHGKDYRALLYRALQF